MALLALSACVSDAAPSPCSSEGRCLPGYTCVEALCQPCAADQCETTQVTLLSLGGGIACGEEETCVRFPRGSLIGVTEVEISRTNLGTTMVGASALSKVFAVRPASLLLLQPVEVAFRVSRQIDLGQAVTVYRASDPRGPWTPLETRRDSLTQASGTTDALGFFVLARGDGAIDGDAGVIVRRDAGVRDAGPTPQARDPIPGMGQPTNFPGAATGLHGLAWDPMQRRMFFADYRDNRVFVFPHMTMGMPPGTPQVFRNNSAGTYGLVVDAQGRLVMTELTSRSVTVGTAPMTGMTLHDRFDGQRFNGPADAAARADGTLYFTDPRTGLMGAPPELAFNGVFRRSPAGTLTAEWRGPATAEPRGIELSPSESVVYVADAAGRAVLAWDVAADGALGNMRTLAMTMGNAPDGLAVDSLGNVYVGTSLGIEVYSPTGERWGVVARPGGVGGLAFGGPGLAFLYATNGTTLSSTPVMVPGVR